MFHEFIWQYWHTVSTRMKTIPFKQCRPPLKAVPVVNIINNVFRQLNVSLTWLSTGSGPDIMILQVEDFILLCSEMKSFLRVLDLHRLMSFLPAWIITVAKWSAFTGGTTYATSETLGPGKQCTSKSLKVWGQILYNGVSNNDIVQCCWWWKWGWELVNGAGSGAGGHWWAFCKRLYCINL